MTSAYTYSPCAVQHSFPVNAEVISLLTGNDSVKRAFWLRLYDSRLSMARDRSTTHLSNKTRIAPDLRVEGSARTNGKRHFLGNPYEHARKWFLITIFTTGSLFLALQFFFSSGWYC